jgi:hypothetical protein
MTIHNTEQLTSAQEHMKIQFLFSRRFVKRFENSLIIKFALPDPQKTIIFFSKREKIISKHFFYSLRFTAFSCQPVASILKIRADREWASMFVRTHLDQSVGR